MELTQVLKRMIVSLAFLGVLPAVATAQSAITGTVRDATGAVLPGVTVEASSPALIEKTRSAVTDGSGVYRIIDLRPGMYSVSFTLTGFNTVLRDGIDLPAAFTATLNAEMRIGSVEETITVSGQAPLVDVSNVAQQTGPEAGVDRRTAGRAHRDRTDVAAARRADAGPGRPGRPAAALAVHPRQPGWRADDHD